MSIVHDNEIVVVRVNPEGERIGILRELLGERWFWDCDYCDIGSGGFYRLSKVMRAINKHNSLYHKPFGLDASGFLCNDSNNEREHSAFFPDPKGA